MEEIEKGWDEFWARIIGIESYKDEENAFRVARFQVKHVIEALDLKEGDNVLDIGCGAGFHCIELAKKNLKVTGIDISSSLINFAKSLTSKHNVFCEFYKMDMSRITFKERFDAILIFNQTFPIFDDKKGSSGFKKI